MMIPKEKIHHFQQYIFRWWKRNKRDLPWRKTHEPYKIFVSEIMLQQTQVARVIPKYNQFIQKYPTVFTLADANVAEVLTIWKGLGYNRRALSLKKSAQIIVNDFKGKFPKDLHILQKLPGLGSYTSRAILIFAFRKETFCIDTNIRNIIEYTFFDGARQKESILEIIAQELIPKGKSWHWHQALMDYGALALPKTRSHVGTVSKKTPFLHSNRYFRGKIIDHLRGQSATLEILHNQLVKNSGKPVDFTQKVLADLAKDGLIMRSDNGIISLPQ